MKTEMINISEFKNRITYYTKKAKERKIRYVVTIYWKPEFIVTPVFGGKIPDVK